MPWNDNPAIDPQGIGSIGQNNNYTNYNNNFADDDDDDDFTYHYSYGMPKKYPEYY